jgi:two-component system OmpR family response regulator
MTGKLISILLVEDDVNMTYLLEENLRPKGYLLTIVHDGKNGLKKFREALFDLCIVDIMLPKMDGFELVAKIRQTDSSVPIIFLTSKAMESDKIKGFKSGCDDYITKPFSLMELDYRIQAILKRTGKPVGQEQETILNLGKYKFHYDTRLLKYPDNPDKKLTKKEGDILKLFCERKNTLISRSFLMNHIWGNDDYFISKSMDVYLTRVRNLIKNDPSLEIVNIYGSGYQLIEREI